jgi:energy-coupling factor transporter ATP-binding protein EcfA2
VAELLDDPRVVELLGSGRPFDTAPPVNGDATGEPVLTLNDVGCEFASGGGLAGINLTVRPGDRWGLTGVNGCGKSTLLALCAGARRPDRGTAVLAGQPLYRQPGLDLDHGRALLAPQFPEYLFTRSDVTAEIALDPALAAQSTEAFLAALGLAREVEHSNPHDLSCGQRRRLALGLVLLSNRPLILLDEPTAALDAAGQERVLHLLAQLPSKTALIIASHDQDFLARAGCRMCEVRPEGLDLR